MAHTHLQGSRSWMGRRALAAVALASAFVAVLLVGPPAASADGPAVCDSGIPTTDPNGPATRYTCDFPFSVPGFGVKQTFNIAPHPGTSEVDATITHMEVDIVDDHGDPVPIQRLMLHHIVFVNLQREDPTCAGQPFTGFDSVTGSLGLDSQRFYAAGEERAKLTLPAGYGYAGGNDTPTPDFSGGHVPWGMVYMVMNHKFQTDHAFIQYSYTVSKSAQAPVVPYWFDEVNCHADPIYNVPGTGGPGSRFIKTVDYTMPNDGRIVAGAGHVHGGAYKLTLTQPDCNDRRVAESIPTWGNPDHPFYHVRPVLHEPGPINMTAFFSETGIPVQAGQPLRLNAIYDNSRPHVRVMGIMIVFVAEGASMQEPVSGPCDPVPADVYNTNRPDGRDGPIPFRIPLTQVDAAGNAISVKGPPGRFRRLRSGATIDVGNGNRTFSVRNAIVRKGATLRYDFTDPAASNELHNLTLANGPLGIGSPNLNDNRVYTQKFRRPGVYRFFCGLHPTQMIERVVVKKKRRHHRHHRRG